MSQYVRMLADGMANRGHQVEIWSPEPFFVKLIGKSSLSKWLGYVDQFIVFPIQVKRKLLLINEKPLFVFTDNALGPWVRIVQFMPHVIHCHDFMAQKSALGTIMENKTNWTGRIYQNYIRRGYNKGKYFISVSQKTKSELLHFLDNGPLLSEVVYNGINTIFKPLNVVNSRKFLSSYFNIDLVKGFLLHIGGNVWYKNRKGVVGIYNEWRKSGQKHLPLLLVGEPGNAEIQDLIKQSAYVKDIHILSNLEDNIIHQLYAGASLFLFPSLEEGFGWPIAEAMACGCLVVTTNEAPMTEVGGEAATYISRRPPDETDAINWAKESALLVDKILNFPEDEKHLIINEGFRNIEKFNIDLSMEKIEDIYNDIYNRYP